MSVNPSRRRSSGYNRRRSPLDRQPVPSESSPVSAPGHWQGKQNQNQTPHRRHQPWAPLNGDEDDSSTCNLRNNDQAKPDSHSEYRRGRAGETSVFRHADTRNQAPQSAGRSESPRKVDVFMPQALIPPVPSPSARKGEEGSASPHSGRCPFRTGSSAAAAAQSPDHRIQGGVTVPQPVNQRFEKGKQGPQLCNEPSRVSQEKGTDYGCSSVNDCYSDDRLDRQPFDLCPPPVAKPFQLRPSLLHTNKQRRMQSECSTSCQNIILRPGMVLLKNFLGYSQQVTIVKQCRDLGFGRGGFYRPGYDDGAKLHLHMMCLGRNWDPETRTYQDIRAFDGAEPPPIPSLFRKLVESAMQTSHDLIMKGSKGCAEDLPKLLPDLCIVNYYSNSGKLGLHQDRDESQESLRKGLPIVSFSIGDSADFLYGDSREEVNTVKLESGDVLIFGGKSRHVFHGISEVHKNTAPKNLMEETNLRPGRLNLTFRQY